ncbi:hypothetical protein LIER_44052 [Lithospermum erythrorhizon]|uniref:Uncharacterized protein n=1 Tax=Lithospermum erythrorhizon TaxID=34254 RepID=A0AAV3NPH0_LITER
MSVDDYYNKLITLFDKFERLKMPHNCSCGKCTCGVITRYEADRDEERLHQFLLGVDDDLYGVVRSNLLSRVPMPTLDEAYSTFVQDENSKRIAHKRRSLILFMHLYFEVIVPCLSMNVRNSHVLIAVRRVPTIPLVSSCTGIHRGGRSDVKASVVLNPGMLHLRGGAPQVNAAAVSAPMNVGCQSSLQVLNPSLI